MFVSGDFLPYLQIDFVDKKIERLYHLKYGHINAVFHIYICQRGGFVEKIKAYLICSTVLMCAFLFGGLLYTAFDETPQIQTVAQQSIRPVVVIDAGHGGEDGGAEANGVLEKNINLSIALKLQDMLNTAGVQTVMVRDTDKSVYDQSAETTRQKKNSDLHNRVKVINQSQNQILVSIHQNKFPQSKYSGTQIFYSKNNPSSAKLAENIRKSVTGLIQPDNKRELKQATDSIFILKKATVPAVIVECGFLSNPDEAKKLTEDAYQQKMSFAIFCGIMNQLK